MADAHMASHYHVLCWHGSGLELGILKHTCSQLVLTS